MIQVCWDISDEKTKQREIQALIKAMNETKCKNALLLTYDTKETLQIKHHTIHVLPVYEWLLVNHLY
ncbi:MAG: hypothetical protein A2298_00855 [Gammaproteobacteria bacterium RIFOXYB2_FULL_38_6]|nr:MAG: hypothetical protein A2298_00855 [Gammaproteobacteria bacterium RIFOXYB2_FULL_38_6]